MDSKDIIQKLKSSINQLRTQSLPSLEVSELITLEFGEKEAHLITKIVIYFNEILSYKYIKKNQKSPKLKLNKNNYWTFIANHFNNPLIDFCRIYDKNEMSNNIKGVNKKYFIKYENIKVSIISAVYNREKYLIRFINSIQKQKFNNIEIILIDDCSEDNSIQIIENFQKYDKRILLIKNKKNKGTFICRNLGVLKSKGEYLILPDPDDILSRDIIDLSYKFAKKYNYEMIRFNIYLGNGIIFFNSIVKKLPNKPIFQPKLSLYLFYGLGKLCQIDFNVSNKFVKRVVFIKALNYLNKYYLDLYMTCYEDGLMNFFLYRTAKSFYFLKKIGYYYIKNKTIRKEEEIKIKTYFIKFQFLYLNLVFEFTKNTLIEKDMFNNLMRIINNTDYFNSFILKKEFHFFNNIINIYLNSTFVNLKNKNKLNMIKNIIINKLKNINSIK